MYIKQKSASNNRSAKQTNKPLKEEEAKEEEAQEEEAEDPTPPASQRAASIEGASE